VKLAESQWRCTVDNMPRRLPRCAAFRLTTQYPFVFASCTSPALSALLRSWL